MKKIGIFGLARTGIASYEKLEKDNHIIVYDDNPKNQQNFVDKFGNTHLKSPDSFEWRNLDYIILSPGIPLHFPKPHKIVDIAKEFKIPLISDIEVFYLLNKNATYVAITGTNGKSTTTALTGYILGNDFAIGGNIGTPVLSLPNKKGYVLELSSYQLDLLDKFKANIAVLLNITPDHLDRHGSLENYIESKKRIWRNLGIRDTLIISVDNDITRSIYESIKEKVDFNIIPISIKDEIKNLPYNNFLLGDHNRENVMASYHIAKVLGYPDEEIISKISTFVGLKHRMQFIRTYRNIDFYNDSKATNAESASKSIAALDNIYWIAGGVPKEGGIKSLSDLFYKIKKAYLFGEAKEQFANILASKIEFVICDDMEEALNNAVKDAIEFGEKASVLLAPACASFDQFKSFEHRGDEFIKLCNQIQ